MSIFPSLWVLGGRVREPGVEGGDTHPVPFPTSRARMASKRHVVTVQALGPEGPYGIVTRYLETAVSKVYSKAYSF